MRIPALGKRAILCALAVAAVLGFARPAAAAVHAGDTLLVTVYDHPELSGPVVVDSTQDISLPFAGIVSVRGLDPSDVAHRLQRRLSAYILKPVVDVQLKERRSTLFVAGGPGGTLAYEPGETLVQAMGALAPKPGAADAAGDEMTAAALSPGDRRFARIDLTRVTIRRDATTLGPFDTVALSAAGDDGPTLQPGDTIALVDKPLRVLVIGDVRDPGPTFLLRDQPLKDALDQAGGLLSSAATSRIELRHDGSTELVALGDPRFNEPADGDDTLTIPTAPRIDVAGQVAKPGTVALKTNFTLLSALYEAGGPTQWADLGKVQVMHDGAKTAYDVTALVHGDTSQNPRLHDGDLVFVPEGRKISQTAINNVFQSLLGAVLLLK